MALHDNHPVTNKQFIDGGENCLGSHDRDDMNKIEVFKKYLLTLLPYNKSWLTHDCNLVNNHEPDFKKFGIQTNNKQATANEANGGCSREMKINQENNTLETFNNGTQSNGFTSKMDITEPSLLKDTNENSIYNGSVIKQHLPFSLGVYPNNIYSTECPLEITVSRTEGRYLKARRNICPGEILLIEPPIAMATRPKSPPNCLSCFKLTTNFKCPNCGFFLCGPECVTDDHKIECQFLKRLGLQESLEERQEEEKLLLERISHMPEEMRSQAIVMTKNAKEAFKKRKYEEMMQNYVIIAALRTLLAVQSNEFHKDLISAMQANLEPGSERHKMNAKFIVDVLVNRLRVSEDSDLLHKICSIWDTNAFHVVIPQNGKIQGLYPFAGLINHDCRPNTQQWFSSKGEIIVRAIDFIQEGDQATISYTDFQWSTLARQDHLQNSKNFVCTCQRCFDPTELKTFLGSLVCNICRSPMLTADPLNTESSWICTSTDCSNTVEAMQENENKVDLSTERNEHLFSHKILSLGSKLEVLTQKLNPRDVSAVVSLAKLLQRQVHPNHYTLMRMYMSVINALVDKDLAEIEDVELGHLLEISGRLNEVTKILQAPLARRRATVAREYLRLKLENIRRGEVKSEIDSRQELMDMSVQLNECVQVLRWDPSMPSPEPLLKAYQNLVQNLN